MNNTPHETLDFGQALAPQAIAAAGTANGPRIVDPAKRGRYLSIFLNNGGLTGVTAFTARLEGSNDGGSTWAPVKQNDGLTDLAFTGARFTAAGSNNVANKVAMGTIELGRGKYQDYRLAVTTVTGATINVSATFLITGLWKEATGVQYPAGQNQYGQTLASSGTTEDFWLNLFLPTGS